MSNKPRFIVRRNTVINNTIQDSLKELQDPLSIYNHDEPCKNRVSDYHDTDRPEFFERGKQDPANKEYVEYWENNPFNYRFNNFGFRTDDDFYEGQEVNMFLGCSHTSGIGWPIEMTWSHMVHSEIGGGAFANLGVGGKGIGTGFRLFSAWSRYFNVKNLFVCYPHPFRYEIADYDLIFKYNTYSPINDVEYSNSNLRKMFLTHETATMYYFSNLLGIYSLASNLGIDMYYIDGLKFGPPTDLGFMLNLKPRDFIHAAHYGHRDLATRAIDMYTNKKTFKVENLYTDKFLLG
jgi:hypothetical protein